MSGGGSRATSVAVAVAAVLLGFSVLWQFVGGTETGTEPERSPGSTQNKGAGGVSGWAELARRNDFQVKERTKPLDAGGLPARGTLVAVDAEGVSKAEAAAVRRWLRSGRGRRLVVAGPLDRRLLWTLPAEVDLDSEGVPEAVVRPAAPAPETAGVEEVAPSGLVPTFPPSGALPLYRLAKGAGIYAMRYEVPGGGTLVAVADDGAVVNAGLRAADNAGFALALCGEAPGPVVFDQYHHMPHEEPGLFAWLPGSWQRGLLQGLLAAVVFALAAGMRFGPPLPEPDVEPRRRIEFVDALAGALRHAKGHAEAAGLIRSDLREHLRRSLRTGPEAGDTALADRARAAGADPATVDTALVRPVTDDESLRAVAGAAAVLRRATGRTAAESESGNPDGTA